LYFLFYNQTLLNSKIKLSKLTKIKKVVVTAAGRGSRLFPLTKETPKEMIPIYVKSSKNSKPVLKPILHVIFDSVYDTGIREFCFVVGRGKRSIEDHFLISENEKLETRKNPEVKNFFTRLNKSHFTYVQQSSPKGFGDAVLKSKSFVNNDSFLLHAGDDAILSHKNDHLQRLEKAFLKYDAEAAILVKRIPDPRAYGVIEGEQIAKKIFRVTNFEEKPKKPKSNLASIGIYLFKPLIFDMLKKVKPDKNGEIQLADALKNLVKSEFTTIAVELNDDEKRVDVGTPEGFVNCIKESYEFFNN
jgi:UTP--glucose-1-phosphate uridylyltransferase